MGDRVLPSLSSLPVERLPRRSRPPPGLARYLLRARHPLYPRLCERRPQASSTSIAQCRGEFADFIVPRTSVAYAVPGLPTVPGV